MDNVKSNPLVSVIMPAYNAEQYIGSAVRSVLEQTYSNFELVIIEDCSTDSTLQKIEEIRDTRIKLYRNEQNCGIAASTNKGLDICKGKYVALLDDDDVAMPERLKIQIDYLEAHKDIDILGGKSIVIDGGGNIIDYGITTLNNPNYIKATLLFKNIDFCNSTAMIRKDFIARNGLRYENNCYGMQDFKFYIESSKVGKLTSINQFLLKYRKHEQNETIKMFQDFPEKRAEKYAEFQKISLNESGYFLDESHMNIIHKALAERGGHCDSFEEIELLYQAFGEILKQARKMDIDYYDELNILCKKNFTMLLAKMELWEDTGV